jgi:hypothetical protein
MFIYCTKESDLIKKPDPEMRGVGGGATSSEAAQEYFGAKWRLLVVIKERSMDPKICCMMSILLL